MLGECPDTHIACTFTPQCQLDSEHQQRIHCHELPNSDVERRLSNMMNLVFHIAPAGGIRWSCRSRFGIVYFNSRPRVGGVPRRGLAIVISPYFNSRPRVGGVGVCSWCDKGICYFNSRPRVGGVIVEQVEGQISLISILAPAWGASAGIYHRPAPEDFTSRPRVGGVGQRLRYAAPVQISILAPAWGASYDNEPCYKCIAISILAPAWGASPCCGTTLGPVSYTHLVFYRYGRFRSERPLSNFLYR